MNIWDAVIVAAIGAGVILAVRHTRKNRKAGKCSGGCDCCGAAASCANRKSQSQ